MNCSWEDCLDLILLFWFVVDAAAAAAAVVVVVLIHIKRRVKNILTYTLQKG